MHKPASQPTHYNYSIWLFLISTSYKEFGREGILGKSQLQSTSTRAKHQNYFWTVKETSGNVKCQIWIYRLASPSPKSLLGQAKNFLAHPCSIDLNNVHYWIKCIKKKKDYLKINIFLCKINTFSIIFFLNAMSL